MPNPMVLWEVGEDEDSTYLIGYATRILQKNKEVTGNCGRDHWRLVSNWKKITVEKDKQCMLYYESSTKRISLTIQIINGIQQFLRVFNVLLVACICILFAI